MMHIKEILTVSLFCLVAMSCESQQATATEISTSDHANFSVTGEHDVNFSKWHVSFILPMNWDANNFESGYDGGFDVELYRFIGPEITSDHRKANPEITFSFHPFKDDTEKNTFLTQAFLRAEEIRLKIEKTYSPKEIGLDLDSAIVHRCNFIVGIDFTCYIIRAVYRNTGVEIWMSADSYIFSQMEAQFLETIRNISFY